MIFMGKCKKSVARLVSAVLLIAVILSLILCSPIYAYAETTDVVKDGVYYSISENGTCYEVVGYDKTKNIVDVVIPSTINYRKVRTIRENAFAGCKSLKSISLPNGFHSIGDLAFSYCTSLEIVNIPSSVYYIGVSAFEHCHALVNITLPSSLREISDKTFYCCYSLKSITIPSGCVSIGASAFCGCNALSRVKFEDNSKIKEISRQAFSGCDVLTAINVPSSVETIDDYAFDGCERLTTVVLREGLKKIGVFAFANCGMQMVEIPQSVEEMGYYCVGFDVPILDTQVVWVRNFKIYGQLDSVANKYAEVFGFEFSYGSPLLISAEYTNDCVEFSFGGNYDTDGVYRVYRKLTGKAYELIGEVKATKSMVTFVDKNIVVGEEYVYNADFVDSSDVVSRRNKDGLSVICDSSAVEPPKTMKEKMKMYRELTGK